MRIQLQNASKMGPKNHGFWWWKSRKINEKALKKNKLFFTSIFHRFFLDFGLVLEALGEVWGGIWPSKMDPKRAKLIFSRKLGFLVGLERILGGFWKDLGRVWGGFWEGFGRIWRSFARSSDFSACFGCFLVVFWLFTTKQPSGTCHHIALAKA